MTNITETFPKAVIWLQFQKPPCLGELCLVSLNLRGNLCNRQVVFVAATLPFLQKSFRSVTWKKNLLRNRLAIGKSFWQQEQTLKNQNISYLHHTWIVEYVLLNRKFFKRVNSFCFISISVAWVRFPIFVESIRPDQFSTAFLKTFSFPRISNQIH